ncbi:superoxide dismutase [Vibrio cholerae]|nr:superoxide dismutase [Vibrio cholerae]
MLCLSLVVMRCQPLRRALADSKDRYNISCTFKFVLMKRSFQNVKGYDRQRVFR